MRFSVVLLLFFLPLLAIAEIGTHPILPSKDGISPGSFYLSGSKPSGVQCVKLADGGYVFRIDAQEEMKKLISGRRIKLAQGDALTMKFKAKVRAKGIVGAGMYLYDAKAKHIGAVYDSSLRMTPEQSDYTISGVVPENPKATSAFDRASFGLIFFDVRQGCDLDIEYIEYEIKKAPEQEVEMPDF
jgi:hypothetical protein